MAVTGSDKIGDLRVVMEEVAEKAANRAAQAISREVQLEMLRMEQRIRTEISNDTKKLLTEYLDMKPNEHAIEHRELRELKNDWRELQKNIMRRVISIVLAGAIAGVAANNGLESINKLKNSNQVIAAPQVPSREKK